MTRWTEAVYPLTKTAGHDILPLEISNDPSLLANEDSSRLRYILRFKRRTLFLNRVLILKYTILSQQPVYLNKFKYLIFSYINHLYEDVFILRAGLLTTALLK
jgi:hypothetical protein